MIRLVIGLGNPGPRFQNTPHNVGAATVQLLASRHNETLRQHRSGTDTTSVFLPGPGGTKVELAVARDFMNVSGRPLARLAQFHKISPEQILVIHDDLDLPAHTLRLKQGGGEGGHNGLKSLTQYLGTRDYARLRIGIGRPPGRMTPADYVLAPIRDREPWDVTYQLAADAVEDVVTRGFTAAQADLHTRGN